MKKKNENSLLLAKTYEQKTSKLKIQLQLSYMPLFSEAMHLPECSAFFSEGLEDCRYVAIRKLESSFFVHSRGEHRTGKQEVSAEDKIAPGLDIDSILLVY